MFRNPLSIGKILLSVALLACGSSKSRVDADRFLNDHYARMRGQDYEGLLDTYSKDFFEATSRDNWRATLMATSAKLGAPESHRVVAEDITERTGVAPGIYVTISCEVRYQKGTAEEKFVLFRLAKDAPFRVNFHTIRKVSR